MTLRLTAAVTLSAAITILILYLMVGLIAEARGAVVPVDVPPIDMPLPTIEDSEIRPDEPPPKRPPDPPRVPEIEPPVSKDPISTEVTWIPQPPRPPGDVPAVMVEPDSPLVAVMRSQPRYPPPLAARGIEGYVDVVFDVLPSGAVTNVVVTNSSHPGFEKSAIEAALRFRYKARVVDGVAVGDSGIRYRFRFRMDN